VVEGSLPPRRVKQNHRQNSIEMIAHIRGPDAQNLNPLRFQPYGSSRIMDDLFWVVVPRAVDLHSEPCSRAVEVEDVGTNRMLAAEFQSLEAAAFDLYP